MNGAICKVCAPYGLKKNLRRVNKKTRHADAKAGKKRLYKCKACNTAYHVN